MKTLLLLSAAFALLGIGFGAGLVTAKLAKPKSDFGQYVQERRAEMAQDKDDPVMVELAKRYRNKIDYKNCIGKNYIITIEVQGVETYNKKTYVWASCHEVFHFYFDNAADVAKLKAGELVTIKGEVFDDDNSNINFKNCHIIK